MPSSTTPLKPRRLEYVEDDYQRKLTLLKRMSSLLHKLAELSILTDSHIFCYVQNESTAFPWVFTTNRQGDAFAHLNQLYTYWPWIKNTARVYNTLDYATIKKGEKAASLDAVEMGQGAKRGKKKKPRVDGAEPARATTGGSLQYYYRDNEAPSKALAKGLCLHDAVVIEEMDRALMLRESAKAAARIADRNMDGNLVRSITKPGAWPLESPRLDESTPVDYQQPVARFDFTHMGSSSVRADALTVRPSGTVSHKRKRQPMPAPLPPPPSSEENEDNGTLLMRNEVSNSEGTSYVAREQDQFVAANALQHLSSYQPQFAAVAHAMLPEAIRGTQMTTVSTAVRQELYMSTNREGNRVIEHTLNIHSTLMEMDELPSLTGKSAPLALPAPSSDTFTFAKPSIIPNRIVSSRPNYEPFTPSSFLVPSTPSLQHHSYSLFSDNAPPATPRTMAERAYEESVGGGGNGTLYFPSQFITSIDFNSMPYGTFSVPPSPR